MTWIQDPLPFKMPDEEGADESVVTFPGDPGPGTLLRGEGGVCYEAAMSDIDSDAMDDWIDTLIMGEELRRDEIEAEIGWDDNDA